MPRIFPVYLFTGDDDYLKKEAVEKLKKALLGKDKSEAFNFSVYDIEKCDIKEVIDTLRSRPFISGKRLVLLRDVEKATEKEQEAVLRYAKNPSGNSCLVLEFSKAELQGGSSRELVKYAREISFILPKGDRIIGWIQKEVRVKGKAICYDAALLLKELKEEDASGLRCEVDKLVTYIGKRHGISREDVETLVGSSSSRGVFEFVDALSRKNAKDALAIAKEMSRAKKPMPEILGMIGWQLRRIKKAQGLLKRGASGRKASIECNVPAFYVERFIKEIKSFTPGEIDRNFNHLLDADYSIKRGYLKPQDALELLIVEMCAKR